MVSTTALVVTYVLGGLTFVPLCLAAFVGFLFYTSPVVLDPRRAPSPTALDFEAKAKPDSVDLGEDQEPLTVYRAGWLTARRSYEPASSASSNDGSYVGMLTSGYRSFMDNRSRDGKARRSKPPDRYFAVLKHNVLFLYESDELNECWAAIQVSSHDVVVYPEGNVDGEFWVKRTAILLKPKQSDAKPEPQRSPSPSDQLDAGTAQNDKAKGESGKGVGQASHGTSTYDAETGQPLPWFLFAKVNSDKEDWYHSLVVASRIGTPTCAAETARDRALFSPDDMSHLVDSIDSLPDSIPMRWFNALLGRVFLSVYRTSSLEDYIVSRIVRKLKRVKTPSMLSEIQVREVDVGSSTPLFSKPMLKELTPDGHASMELHVSYVGHVRITIETVATVSISSRFKPYSVRLVLAVVLEELEGTVLVKIKGPPSNRVWFGFTHMPTLKLNVEPVVSTRQIKWSMVTSPIESRIREVIAESIVCPHMDDISFFSTQGFPATARGGIYGHALRKERPDLNVPATAPDSIASGTATTPVGASETVKKDSTGQTLGTDEALLEGVEEEGEGVEGAKDKAKEVEGVLISEGKETVDRARQRIRRPSSSSTTSSTTTGYRLQATSSREDDLFDADSRSPVKPTKKQGTTGSSGSIKTSASSSSVSSSLAGLASAGLASWREKGYGSKGKDRGKVPANGSEDSLAATSVGEERAAQGRPKKRTSSWFSTSSPAPSPALDASGEATPSSASPAAQSTLSASLSARKNRTNSNSSTSTTTSSSFVQLNEPEGAEPVLSGSPANGSGAESATTTKTGPVEEVSAAKLKEILTKRAESRERERRERQALEEAVAEAGREKVLPDVEGGGQTSAGIVPLIEVDAGSPTPASPTLIDLSAKSLDSTAPASPVRTAGAPAPPPLPNRPAWVKPSESDDATVPPGASETILPPPPPIRRTPSHTSSASVDSAAPSSPNSTATAASLLSSWRAKASDKEAIAQSVAQAKESMKRWGAGWNARRTAGRPPDAEGAGLVGLAPEVPPKPGQEPGSETGYRDYRSRTASANGDKPNGGTGEGGATGYYAPSDSRTGSPTRAGVSPPPRREQGLPHQRSTSSSTASPSRMRASSIASTHSTLANATAQFEPTTAGSPASKLSAINAQPVPSTPPRPIAGSGLAPDPTVARSPVSSPSTSPTKPGGIGGSSSGGGYGYRPATMMQLPGIRDEGRRKLVSEDHLGGGLPVTLPPSSAPQPAAVHAKTDRAEPSADTRRPDAPARGELSPPTVVPHAVPPSLPPRASSPGPPQPSITSPALPPRPQEDAVEALSDTPSTADARPEPLPEAPTVPLRTESPLSIKPEGVAKSTDVDELADEAGWGLDEDSTEEKEERPERE
ncbi:hypothetical protein JCM10212_002191 [Sporobolomyces blumeae]